MDDNTKNDISIEIEVYIERLKSLDVSFDHSVAFADNAVTSEFIFHVGPGVTFKFVVKGASLDEWKLGLHDVLLSMNNVWNKVYTPCDHKDGYGSTQVGDMGSCILCGEMPPQPVPIPMIINCPMCGERHVDKGIFATKAHHTHSCQSCGFTWRPAVVPTVGVQFLPGFKDE